MAWESLEKWARLEIQDWLQELMVVLFQKARVLAQEVLPPLSVGEMALRLYGALNYSQNRAHDLRYAPNEA